MITAAQCRAARALLNWTQDDLAKAAQVGIVTVRQFESANAVPRNSTLVVLTQALETAGVEFIPENGGGAGVRLRRPFLVVNGSPVVPVEFRLGDKVRFLVGKEDRQELRGNIGTVIEVETYPIEIGPVPRVRVRFDDHETAWHIPSMFVPASSS